MTRVVSRFSLLLLCLAALLPSLRSSGRVRIVNWHKFTWETEAKLAKRKGVDKRGARSDDAWLRDVLGDTAKARVARRRTRIFKPRATIPCST